MRWFRYPLLTLALALAACQTAEPPPRNDPDAAYDLSVRLAGLIGRCWFSSGDPVFANYSYSPERNADQSRILIIRKVDPTGLPVMVVEPRNASVVQVYGPLAAGPAGPRLRADVDRWTRGNQSCT